MHIINTLSPVFLLIALGACLRKANFFSDDFVQSLTKLVFWVAMPCMIFYKVASASYDFEIAGKTFLVFLIGMLTAGLIAWAVAMCLRLKSVDTGTFIQSAVHGNLIFVGLAVIFYDIANTNPPNAQYLQTLAVIVVAFAIIFNNFVAVIVLKVSQHTFGLRSLLPVARGLLTNPVIISSIAGIAYSCFFDSLPKFLSLTLNAAGTLALPAILIAIGATLVQAKIAESFNHALICATIKVSIAPIAGFFVSGLLGVSGGELKIALILLASPTAVAAHILATRLNGNTQLSAAVIVLSTLLSIASLATVIALF